MSEYQIVGPFQSHRVIADGRRVPFLEALPVNGGKLSLLLDGRYALDVSVADAEAFIPWIAMPSPQRATAACCGAGEV